LKGATLTALYIISVRRYLQWVNPALNHQPSAHRTPPCAVNRRGFSLTLGTSFINSSSDNISAERPRARGESAAPEAWASKVAERGSQAETILSQFLAPPRRKTSANPLGWVWRAIPKFLPGPLPRKSSAKRAPAGGNITIASFVPAARQNRREVVDVFACVLCCHSVGMMARCDASRFPGRSMSSLCVLCCHSMGTIA
jgi:hypothetical protein